MAKGEQRHVLRRVFVCFITIVALVAATLGVLQWRYGTVDEHIDDALVTLGLPEVFGADPLTEPAKVRPPGGLELPTQPAAPAVAAASSGPPADPRALRDVISPLLRDPGLGSHVGVVVSDVDGRVLVRSGTGIFTPASTLKLLTATSALTALGPETRYRTDVRRTGNRLILVGGGDPYLAGTPADAKGLRPTRATLTQLAERTAAALKADPAAAFRLSYDDTLFTGPALNPTWQPTYFSEGVVPPIHALWVNQGHQADGTGFIEDPAGGAANQFAAMLQQRGVRIVGAPRAAAAPSGATPVASVTGPTVAQIVEHLIDVSDNNAAEVLLRHLGLKLSGEGSFTAGSAAMRQQLAALGVDTAGLTSYDGSGLSRQNELRPQVLSDVLALAASGSHPELSSVLTGLSVAAFDGSLKDRFDDDHVWAKGRVHAKTGTLSEAGVHSLAGIAVDRDGTPLVFTLVADKVKVDGALKARDALDSIAAAIADCSCAGTAQPATP